MADVLEVEQFLSIEAGVAQPGIALLQAAVLSWPGNKGRIVGMGTSMSNDEKRVVIGMDPHKWAVSVAVMTGDQTVVGGDRFATDTTG